MKTEQGNGQSATPGAGNGAVAVLPETSAYDAAEYEAEIVKVRMFASLIQAMPLEQMLEQANRADAIGAILDPTLYRKKMDGLEMDIALLRAFATAKRDTRKAVEAFMRRKGGNP